MPNSFENWIRENGIGEVECLVPDMNGIVRGKVFPAQKFLKSERDGTLRIPSSIYMLTVTGDYAEETKEEASDVDPDVILRPDLSTIRIAPGYRFPTAFVIADGCHGDGSPYEVAPRHVLKTVVELYEDQGWSPVIAPELEFYLTKINPDPDLPLEPPAGRSGRPETAPQPYGLEAITEYEDLIENVYEFAEQAELQIDTLIHESGTAQLEINFNHGQPVALADQVILFKRLVRQVALSHKVYATFMAKPMSAQPGSAMHIHQSVIDLKTGENIFSLRDGRDSPAFRHFIGGLQKYLPEVVPLFAPNVNSYRRMHPSFAAPINVQWGYDNRTCGLRVPVSDGQNRRVENRLPGADANPYLAIAASLVCGYMGMMEKLEPTEALDGNAYQWARTIPRTLEESLDRFNNCAPVRNLLGDDFSYLYAMIKNSELEAYRAVISSWERDHLLLKV
jgi:glutamine synthetase